MTLATAPRGGLGAVAPQPQAPAAPPTAQMQQNANMALAQQNQEEFIEPALAGAADIGDQQFIQMLRQRLAAGLPSAQEISRAQQARRDLMQRQLQLLQPTEYSGMDNLAGAVTSLASNPELLKEGNMGAALGMIGQAAQAGRRSFEDREFAKAGAAYNLVDKDLDTQEKRMFDAITRNQRMASMAGGAVTRQLPDGTIVIIDKNSGQELRRIGPNESKQFASFFETFMKIGAEKGEYADLDQLRTWATKKATEALGQSQAAAGAAPAPSAPTVPPVPEKTPSVAASAGAMRVTPEVQTTRDADAYEILRSEIATASKAGNRAEVGALLNEMQKRFPNGRPAPGVTPPDQVAPGLPKKDIAGEAGRKKTAEEAADMYAKSFDENVLKPSISMANTGKIMQDFNNLGQMQYALKNGKLKEFMAGETGKWAMSFLPEDSDLRKGVANAQEAEKLTASMVNQILLAAKGVQTEGDAQRARSQVTQIGTDPDANKYLEAYISETARQLKLREMTGRAHKKQTGTFEGYDDTWRESPIMKDAKGSVKKLGGTWIGLTQYVDKFKEKNPSATEADAVASWNRVK